MKLQEGNFFSRVRVCACLFTGLHATPPEMFTFRLTIQKPPFQDMFKLVYNEEWIVGKRAVDIRLKYFLVYFFSRSPGGPLVDYFHGYSLRIQNCVSHVLVM